MTVNRKMNLVGLSCHLSVIGPSYRAIQQLWLVCSWSCLDFSMRQNKLKTERKGQT